MGLIRWRTASIREAEEKLLSYVKTPHTSFFVPITLPRRSKESLEIWTTAYNDKASFTDTELTLPELQITSQNYQTLVLLHGLLTGSAAPWASVVDSLTSHFSPIYTPDLLGCGQSSRPKDLTLQDWVESLESWRQSLGIEKMVLVGHSLGGYISTHYALKYPERVAHLGLADPWGFPERPARVTKLLNFENFLMIQVAQLWGKVVNPWATLRHCGPWATWLVKYSMFYSAIRKHNLSLVDEGGKGEEYVREYFCRVNARRPASAEDTYRKTLMTYYIYARDPLVNHFHRLDPSVPVTYMWGQKSPIPGVRSQTELEKLRGNLGGYCKFVNFSESFHEVFIDQRELFLNTVKCMAGKEGVAFSAEDVVAVAEKLEVIHSL